MISKSNIVTSLRVRFKGKKTVNRLQIENLKCYSTIVFHILSKHFIIDKTCTDFDIMPYSLPQ